MSQLLVGAINNPSAPSGGLILSADGNVKGSGLDLIVSQSFTAAAAVNVNNCFSSAYANYRIVAKFSASATGNGYVRLRVASADDSSAAYSYSAAQVSGASNVALANGSNVSAWAPWYANASGHSSLDLTAYDPAVAIQTVFTSLGSYNNSGVWAGGYFTSATVFDGFTIYPGSGTITGTLRVYGYRN